MWKKAIGQLKFHFFPEQSDTTLCGKSPCIDERTIASEEEPKDKVCEECQVLSSVGTNKSQ